MTIQSIEKYLKKHDLDYYGRVTTLDYFNNVTPLKAHCIQVYIDFDTDPVTATEQQKHLDRYIRRYSIPSNIYIYPGGNCYTLWTEEEQETITKYNHYKEACISEYWKLREKHADLFKKHPARFNEHIKKLIDIYGNYYKLSLIA